MTFHFHDAVEVARRDKVAACRDNYRIFVKISLDVGLLNNVVYY
jgi:hypothetical protein